MYEVLNDLTDNDSVEHGYERVLEQVQLEGAALVADAKCRVVVGVSDTTRVLELVQKCNLRDHLRGNQELEAEARYLAMGAEVIDASADPAHRCRPRPRPFGSRAAGCSRARGVAG